MSQFSLGEAVLGTSADTSGLDRDLNKAEGQTRSWLGRLEGVFQSAAGFLVANVIQRGLSLVTSGIIAASGAMIGGNAAFEQYNTQFQVLLGSAEAAEERMAELADFGKRTPFDLSNVVEADRILQGFGLHSEEAARKFGFSGEQIRTIAGDVASGTGASFQDMATLIGKFSSGATGEAISRMQELGITTREELARLGLEFSKSGELLSPLPDAMSVVLRVMQDKYGGMMDAQSRTFEGMMSNLRDWVSGTLREIGRPLFDLLKDKLELLLEFLGSPAVQSAVEQVTQLISQGMAVALEHGEAVISSLVAFIERDGLPAFQRVSQAVRGVVEIAKLLVTGDYTRGFFEVLGMHEDSPLVGLLLTVRRVFVEAGEVISGVAYLIGDAWYTIWHELRPVLAGLGGELLGSLGGIFDVEDSLSGVAEAVISFLIPPFREFTDFVVQQVIPVIGEIGRWFFDTAIPAIQEFAAAVGPVITQIVEWIATNVNFQDILVAIGGVLAFLAGGAISGLVASLGAVVPAISPVIAIFVGLVAAASALRQAWESDWMGIRTALTQFWEDKARPALTSLWEWLQTRLPEAIATARDFWETSLVPAFERVSAFIVDDLIPAFTDARVWLEENLPAAIATLKAFWEGELQPALQRGTEFWETSLKPALERVGEVLDRVVGGAVRTVADLWENTLQPALKIVWEFVDTSVLPLLRSVGHVIDAVVGLAVRVLAGLWENVLLPALRTVWEFIDIHIMPIFRDLAELVEGTLGPRIETFRINVLDPMKRTFSGIGGIIQDVIRWLEDFATNIENIQLPDWLERHSPAPIEQTLMGMARQLREVNALMPEMMGGTLAIQTSSAPGTSGAAAASAPPQIGPFYFEGTGLPRDEQEAEDGAFLLVNALQARGAL